MTHISDLRPGKTRSVVERSGLARLAQRAPTRRAALGDDVGSLDADAMFLDNANE